VFDFKNYVLKIMPKSLSRHLGRLQGKLKLTEKTKVHIFPSVLFISLLQWLIQAKVPIM